MKTILVAMFLFLSIVTIQAKEKKKQSKIAGTNLYISLPSGFVEAVNFIGFADSLSQCKIFVSKKNIAGLTSGSVSHIEKQYGVVKHNKIKGENVEIECLSGCFKNDKEHVFYVFSADGFEYVIDGVFLRATSHQYSEIIKESVKSITIK